MTKTSTRRVLSLSLKLAQEESPCLRDKNYTLSGEREKRTCELRQLSMMQLK